MLKYRFVKFASMTARNITTTSFLRNDPPQRYDQEVPSFKPIGEIHARKIEEDKKRLEWRVKPMDQPGHFKSKLRVFDSEENAPNSLAMIVQPIDFSIAGLKSWWGRYQARKEKFFQQYIPERHKTLGNDLAAAHFLLFRRGKVMFVGQNEWMEVSEEDEEKIPLPNRFDPSYELESIKCDNMELYYEGLENIRRLKKLKYLSFKNVKLFDDWGLDRVSGSEFNSLEVLDVSGTKVTANGLQALYRMPSLKKFIADPQPEDNYSWHLTVSMLQEILPDLEVVSTQDV